MSGSVVVYDLSRSCGWAVYQPGRTAPVHRVLKLPPTFPNGSNGPALKLLFEHIEWVDRTYGPLIGIGFEGFLAPTGGKRDNATSFITSPKTTKRLAGYIAVVELCAEMLGIPTYEIHNASWKSLWLGSTRRGTKRPELKALSIERAKALGWAPHGDDDADAIGQLHWLLNHLGIEPGWKTDPTDLLQVQKPEGPMNV